MLACQTFHFPQSLSPQESNLTAQIPDLKQAAHNLLKEVRAGCWCTIFQRQKRLPQNLNRQGGDWLAQSMIWVTKWNKLWKQTNYQTYLCSVWPHTSQTQSSQRTVSRTTWKIITVHLTKHGVSLETRKEHAIRQTQSHCFVQIHRTQLQAALCDEGRKTCSPDLHIGNNSPIGFCCRAVVIATSFNQIL